MLGIIAVRSALTEKCNVGTARYVLVNFRDAGMQTIVPPTHVEAGCIAGDTIIMGASFGVGGRCPHKVIWEKLKSLSLNIYFLM